MNESQAARERIRQRTIRKILEVAERNAEKTDEDFDVVLRRVATEFTERWPTLAAIAADVVIERETFD